MKRKSTWERALLVSVLAFVIVPAAWAGDDAEKVGQYRLEGTWWREVGGPAYMTTIVRVGPQEWSGVAVNLEEFSPGEVLDYFGTTRASDVVTTMRRAGVNSYEFTSIQYFGDDDFAAPYRGTAWAFITNGTLIQDGPDHFAVDLNLTASCNPCHPYCWAHNPASCEALGEALWDPFADPYRACGGTHRIEYRRVPMDHLCE